MSHNSSRRGEANGLADEHARFEPIPFAYPERGPATDALDELFAPGASVAARHEELASTMASARTQVLYNGQSTNICKPNAAKRPRSSPLSPPLSSSERGERHGAAVSSKEEVRKLKNRVSAAKSRQRAQDHIRSLEHTVDALQRRNAFLCHEVQRLITEQQHRQAQSSVHQIANEGAIRDGRWTTR